MKPLKLLLGFLLFSYMAYTTLFQAVPRMYVEWFHADEFTPAYGARIVQAKCTNFEFVLFNHCVVTAVTASGEQLKIEDERFGRAPTGKILLLMRASTPPSYSTSVSLETINKRLYFLRSYVERC
jgi:hypothetical protein